MQKKVVHIFNYLGYNIFTKKKNLNVNFLILSKYWEKLIRFSNTKKIQIYKTLA
jgi:hypothetical protein